MKKALAEIAALLIGFVAVVAAAGVAQAQDGLIASSPANHAALTARPKEIILKMDSAPVLAETNVSATSFTGEPVSLAAPTVEGDLIKAGWPQDAPIGTYTVSWRTVTANSGGQPMAGTLQYSYTQSAVTLEPRAPAAATPSESGPVAGPGTRPAGTVSTSGGFNWLFPTFAGVGLLILVVVAGLVLRKIRSKGEMK